MAVSRGEAEGAAAISSCTHVPFLSVLRFERKQQEVGSGGKPKKKITDSVQENMLRNKRKGVTNSTALRFYQYWRV